MSGVFDSGKFTRRAVLAGSGAAALAVVAACSGSGDDGGARGSRETADVGIRPGEPLAATADVPVGGGLSVTVDDKPLLVTQPTKGTFAAFSAVCTHQGCTVLPGSGELKCPCHGSRFDLATGRVLAGPAPAPLPEVKVTVSGTAVTSA